MHACMLYAICLQVVPACMHVGVDPAVLCVSGPVHAAFLEWLHAACKRTCEAITNAKLSKKLGLDSRSSSGDSSMKLPATDSFSSCSRLLTWCALDSPRLEASRRKLLPRSEGSTCSAKQVSRRALQACNFCKCTVVYRQNQGQQVPGRTLASSTMVKAAMPPSTRFFNVSEPVGPHRSRQILADSSKTWPCAPHILSCRSYFLLLASTAGLPFSICAAHCKISVVLLIQE